MMGNFIYRRILKNRGLNFNKLNYGVLAVKSVSSGYISIKQKDSIQQLLKNNIKNFKFNLIFNKVKTKKSLETRMGGGKGYLDMELYFIKPGSIFIEFYNITICKALILLNLINNKVSVKLKLLKNK